MVVANILCRASSVERSEFSTIESMKLCALALLALFSCLAASPAIDKAKAIGNPSAPIVIEVYSSFDCPHCKIMHDTVEPTLIQDYVMPGKVYLVKREFPLSGQGHQYAREAAIDATAAARIGKYEPVANALYKNQGTWAAGWQGLADGRERPDGW